MPSDFNEALDDSQGKHKTEDARSRSWQAYAALFVGACLGFMFAQYLYLHTYSSPDPASSRSNLRLSVKGGKAGSGTALAASSSGGGGNSELEALLQRIAPDREVMIAISNYNLIRTGMLPTWLETVQQTGTKKYLVVAIDKELADYLTAKRIPVYFKDLTIDKAQEGTGDNHAISALKFKIIAEFLKLGWSVLLSDVDIVVVQDPFKHLYRDADVEGMSDGYDQDTAYGHIDHVDDPTMGWSRYAQATRHMAFNSGLFYIQANSRTLDLMNRIARRLAREKAWDQSVFNQELFFLSHDGYTSPGCSVRVMSMYLFMNSKVLFKTVRHLPAYERVRPVMVHMNYHPDKHARMLAVADYYINGNTAALDPFPGGSEPGS